MAPNLALAYHIAKINCKEWAKNAKIGMLKLSILVYGHTYLLFCMSYLCTSNNFINEKHFTIINP